MAPGEGSHDASPRGNEKPGRFARVFAMSLEVYWLGGVAGLVAGGLGVAVPGFATGRRGSMILMRMILGGSFGRLLRGSAAMRAIFFTTSRSWHCPKIVCLPLRWGVGTSVMKNCEPLVLGPLLAIASRPGWSKVREGLNSSLKLYPGSPCPLPIGSPPWIMKFGMTRWKMVPL